MPLNRDYFLNRTPVRTWEYEAKICDPVRLADWLNEKDAEGWEYVTTYIEGPFHYHTFRRPYRTPIIGDKS